MGASHTPGPWASVQSNGVKNGVIAVDDDANDQFYIGKMSGPDAEANARLIATAPELLEALEEAVQWDSHDSEGVPAVWLEKARAALAKARGTA